MRKPSYKMIRTKWIVLGEKIINNTPNHLKANFTRIENITDTKFSILCKYFLERAQNYCTFLGLLLDNK